jgi:hypothetical protein
MVLCLRIGNVEINTLIDQKIANPPLSRFVQVRINGALQMPESYSLTIHCILTVSFDDTDVSSLRDGAEVPTIISEVGASIQQRCGSCLQSNAARSRGRPKTTHLEHSWIRTHRNQVLPVGPPSIVIGHVEGCHRDFT